MFFRRNNKPSTRTGTRPSYQLGNCKNLKGHLYVLSIFLDDKESSWTDASRISFWNKEVKPGFQFLSKEASKYGVRLSFEHGSFYTGCHPVLESLYQLPYECIKGPWVPYNFRFP